jgi:hypothetical protein
MSCFENMGRTLGRASMRVILILSASSGYHCEEEAELAWCGRKRGREERGRTSPRSSLRKSWSSPAYSTPVGPPPTTTYIHRPNQYGVFRRKEEEGTVTHERKKPVNLRLSLSSKVGRLDAVHDPGTDLLRIPSLLEEASVLLNTLDAERLVLGSNGVDEVVVGDLGARHLTLDLRVVCATERALRRKKGKQGKGKGRTDETNSLLRGVNLVDLSLVDLSLALEVTGEETGRLEDGTSSEGADRYRGEEGGEEEVVARGDDDLRVARSSVVVLALPNMRKEKREGRRKRRKENARRCNPGCPSPSRKRCFPIRYRERRRSGAWGREGAAPPGASSRTSARGCNRFRPGK